MTDDCPSRLQWIRLIDEQLTRSEEAKLRRHLIDCHRCQKEHAALQTLTRDLAAPLGREPPSTAAVLGRLTEPHAPDAGARPIRARRLAGALGALGAVAALAAGLALWIGRTPADPFQPRGGAAAADTLSRQVGVKVYSPLGQPALADGARVRADVPFTATYRSVRARAHLLLFAVDARDQVHWLYPAYLDARSDPLSVELAQHALETPLPDSSLLEDLPPGALRLVAIISQEALHVSDIERRPPGSLTRSQLAARWPAAAITEWRLTVESPR